MQTLKQKYFSNIFVSWYLQIPIVFYLIIVPFHSKQILPSILSFYKITLMSIYKFFKLTRRNETDAYHAASYCFYVFLFVSYTKKATKRTTRFFKQFTTRRRCWTIGGLHGVISEISSDKKKVTLDCEGALFDFDQQSIRSKK